MRCDDKIIKSAKQRTEKSQQEKFPYFVDPNDVFGLKIQVNKHVFSPKYFKGYMFFTPKLPDVSNKSVLEIGSGCGVASLYLAGKARCVLATDIIKYAVENTKINAKHNNLKNLKVRYSDVFSNIKSKEKFDVIYWNAPWVKVPKEYEEEMTPENYGTFDAGYRAISRFILEGRKHLNKNGALFLGIGVEGADLGQIEDLVKKSGLKKKVIADDYFSLGKEANGRFFKSRLLLYRLSP